MKVKEIVETNEKNFTEIGDRRKLEDMVVLSGVNILIEEMNDKEIKEIISGAIDKFMQS